MVDTNVILILNDGSSITVKSPRRVGREYGTSWLHDRLGCREWNIDIEETLSQWRHGNQFLENPFFIIGEFGTGYGCMRDCIYIPFSSVDEIRLV